MGVLCQIDGASHEVGCGQHLVFGRDVGAHGSLYDDDTVLFHYDLPKAGPADGPSWYRLPLARHTETFSPPSSKKSSSTHRVCRL